MNVFQQQAKLFTRRHFLRRCNSGIGAAALASLMNPGLFTARAARAGEGPDAAGNPLAVRPPMFAPKAKRVIYLHMSGSPPQHDLFDFKPDLVKLNGQPCPESFIKGER